MKKRRHTKPLAKTLKILQSIATPQISIPLKREALGSSPKSGRRFTKGIRPCKKASKSHITLINHH